MTVTEKLFVVAFIVLLFGVMRIPARKARRLLEIWAQSQDLELIEARPRLLRRGPITGTTSKSQVVFYVKTRDQAGSLREGYARCGGFLSGLRGGQVDVQRIKKAAG